MAKRKRRSARFPWSGLKRKASHGAHGLVTESFAANLHLLEALEPRVLLTTLYGGESFEYIQQDPLNPLGGGRQVRVSINGDAIVELISADLLTDGTGVIEFGDTPGRIIPFNDNSDTLGPLSRADTDVRGGIGGADGVELIGPNTPITDPTGTVPPPPNAASVNITALASQPLSDGAETYGFNVYTANNTPFVTLLQLDNNDGSAQVTSSLQGARLSPNDAIATFVDNTGNASPLVGATAMAFDETTGLGYAIADGPGGDHLYRFSRFSGEIEDLGVIRNTSTGSNLNDIEAMAISPNGVLYFITSDYDGNPNADASGIPANATQGGNMGGGGMATFSNQDVALVNLGLADNIVAGAFVGFTNGQAQSIVVNQTINGLNQNFEVVTPYTGMTFNPQNPNQVFAVNTTAPMPGQAAVSSLHRIGLGGGPVVVALDRGQITVGGGGGAGMVRVEGLAAAVDRAGNDVLVGLDLSVVVNNVIQPRLLSMPIDNPQAGLLNTASNTITANAIALASYEEPGVTPGRPFLYTTQGPTLIRGTAISMPVDPATGLSTVTAINAADFHPNIGSARDGDLYFVGSASNLSDRIYILSLDVPPSVNDPTVPDPIAVQNSLVEMTGVNNGGLGNNNITSIAFDQAGATADLLSYNTANGQLRPINLNNGSILNNQNPPVVTLTGQGVVAGGSGIEVIDDPDVSEQFVYLVDNNNDRLLRVNYNMGVPNAANQYPSQYLGPLADPDHVNNINPFAGNRVPAPRRGTNIVGLSYNETVFNPFTGEYGALIATDSGTDELLVLDSRTRAPAADVFVIYVTQAAPDATISIAVVPNGPDIGFESVVNQVGPNGRFRQTAMTPFTNTINSGGNAFGVVNAQNGNAIFVSADGNTGEVMIGTRTFTAQNPDPRIHLNPIYDGSTGTQVGTRAGGVDDLPDDDTSNISAGVFITESVLDYFEDLQVTPVAQQTLGSNLDQIVAMSIARGPATPGGDPLAAAIDTDGVDAFGNQIDADELAIFPLTLGFDGFNALTGIVRDDLTLAPLSGVQDIDFGDLDFDGSEELFAIYLTDEHVPTQSVGGVAIATANTVDIAIARDGNIYTLERAAGNTARLRRVNRDPVSGQVTGTTNLGLITDGNGNPIIDLQTITIHPTAHGDQIIGAGRRDRDSDGTVETEQELFLITPITRDVDFDTVADEVFANPIGLIGGQFNSITNSVRALVFDNTGADLYAFVDTDGTLGGDSLLVLDPSTAGIQSNLGAVQAGGQTVQVRGGSAIYTTGDTLIVVDDVRDVLVRVDTTTPSNSFASSEAVPATLRGMVRLGRNVFSINTATGSIDTNLTDAPILGRLDTAFGTTDLDQDFYGFFAQPGDSLTVALTGLSLSDPLVRLFDAMGNELAFDDDGGPGLDSLLTFDQFPAAGQYFIVADAFGTETGTYTLTASLTTPNFTSSGAAAISNETEQNDDGDGIGTINDILFANDISGSFVDVGMGQFDATIIGSIGGGGSSYGHFSQIGPVGDTGDTVQAMAFSGRAGSSGAQGLFIIDGNDQMAEVNPLTGARVGQSATVRDAETNQVLSINSFDFNRAGFAFAQDQEHGRLVNLNITFQAGVGVTAVTAGNITATEESSLRPTVGSIAYDFTNDRYLAVDNAASAAIRQGGQYDNDPFEPGESIINAPNEAAIIMTVAGTTTGSAVGQTIGSVLIGGTILGKVDLSGSAELFYAGWILTGEASGLAESDIGIFGIGGMDLFGNVIGVPDNFSVAGDLRGLVTLDALGTDNDTALHQPTYLPGFDAQIGGRLGQVLSLDSIIASFDVEDQSQLPGIAPLGSVQSEYERRGASFQGGGLSIAGLFNDTFATAQYLSTFRSGVNGDDNIVNITGTLIDDPNSPNTMPDARDDHVDYFAMPLLAGQEIIIQLITLMPPPFLHIGVIDPEGRLVATDYSNLDAGEVTNQAFKFKADKAGAYRLAVAWDGDINFDGVLQPATETWATSSLPHPYLLTVQDAGPVSIGGIVAGQNIFNNTPVPSIRAQQGDIGSVVAGRDGTGILIFEDDAFNFGNDIESSRGNLREIDVQASGRGTAATMFPAQLPIIGAAGDIGLLQARGGIQIGNSGPFIPGLSGVLRFSSATAGGDLQHALTASDFYINLVAGGGLGVVSAGQMTSDNTPSTFLLNADLIGNDGIVDLFDIRGDFGTVTAGGPQITTGPGGNVRFIRVLGEIYQDAIFGGGDPTQTQFLPGTAANLRDDSGATFSIVPLDPVLNPDYVESIARLIQLNDPRLDPDSDVFNPNLTDDIADKFILGSITSLTTYGIRGSGGVVVVNVSADHSLAINSTAAGINQGAEISEIFISADGTAVFVDPVTGQTTYEPEDDNMTPDDPTDDLRSLRIAIGGPNPVDVFSIQAASTITVDRAAATNTSAYTTGTFDMNGTMINVVRGGSFTSIINSSGAAVGGGEIVSLDAGSIGVLSSQGTIGLTESHTGQAVAGTILPRFVALPFPFLFPSTVIRATQIGQLNADGGIGNVVVINDESDQPAVIGVINANLDNRHFTDTFDGIEGPIYAMTSQGSGSEGSIGTVHIGDGILPSGTGNFSRAGIYSDEDIGLVIGNNADIRGDIVTSGSLKGVRLTNGSIINADIMAVTDLADSREYVGSGGSLEDLATTGGIMDDFINFPGNEIGDIILSGDGGILGLLLDAQDIGKISVSRGFGLFNATINRQGNDVEGDTRVDGFGIRDVVFSGGATQKNIIATGKGDILDPTDYSDAVRFSELFQEQGISLTDTSDGFDPFFGYKPNRLTDLNVFLSGSPDPAGLHSGVIDNVFAEGSRDLKNVQAYRIVATNGLVPTSFQFANTIGNIKVIDLVDFVDITSGAIKSFAPGGDVNDFTMTIAGEIGKVDIKGNLTGMSSIFASGPNGNLKNVKIAGNASGTIGANGQAGTIAIGGNLTGNIIIDGSNAPGKALKTFKLGGSLANGSFRVIGDVGTIDVAKGLGITNELLLVDGNLQNLKVGTDRKSDGAIVGLDIIVFGDLNNLDIDGALTGDLIIQGNINKLAITADALTANTDIVSGDINIFGEAKTIQIDNGHVGAGNVIAVAQGIGKFALTNGDMKPGSEVSTAFADIKNVTVKNGDVFGRLLANNGDIDSITITGSDLGNGVDAALISTQHIKKLSMDGSVRSGAVIDVLDGIDNLSIGGSVDSGALVRSGESPTVKIGASIMGAVLLGASSRGTKVSVGGSVGDGISTAMLSIDGDAKIDIGGDISSTGTIDVGLNLDQLTVKGMGSGDVFVDGFGGKFSFAGLEGAVITTGFDLAQLDVGDIDRSLVQVGARRGADKVFAATEGQRDFGEGSVRSTLGKFSAGSISDSIIAASGDIGSAATASTVTTSSISSGFSVGSSALGVVVADATPLADAVDRNAARGASDRELLHGDIGAASFGGGLIGSAITAGVDPGNDGIFGNVTPDAAMNDSVLVYAPGRVLPEGAGQSLIKKFTGNADANSAVLADTGIGGEVTGQGLVNPNVTYPLADLFPNNPLPGASGFATDGAPLNLNNVLIEVKGNGRVFVHDNLATGNVIEGLVLDGTDSKTVVTVTVANADTLKIGRLLSNDDASLKAFESNVDIIGDVDGFGVSSADVDIFIDGPIGGANTFAIRDLGDNVRGAIGGGVANVSMRTQGAGVLRITGPVKKATIENGNAGGLTVNEGTVTLPNVTQLAVDSSGNAWVFDEANRQIARVNTVSGAILDGPFNVDTSGLDDRIGISGLSFNAFDSAISVATINNQSPTHLLGTPANPTDPINLSTLAVTIDGTVLAIDSSTGRDVLVAFNTDNGGAFPVGVLNDIFSNTYNGDFYALATDDDGNLYGLVRDRDGNGAANGQADGAALVKIDLANPQVVGNQSFLTVSSPTSVGLPGVFLDGGGVLNSFPAMAIQQDALTTTIFAIRRDGVASSDDLVTIADDGTVTSLGTVKVDTDGDGIGDTDTSVVGMGFDEEGNLVALDNNGAQAGTILIDPTSVDINGNVVATRITTASALDPALDAFAVGRSGDNFPTFAYDTDALGGRLYTNPSNENINVGTFDPRPNLQVNGDLGAIVNAHALAIRPTGNTFIVTDNGGGGFDLQRIDRTLPGDGVSGLTNLGTIGFLSGPTIQNIDAMEASPFSGQLFVVGTRSGSSTRELFSVTEVGAFAASRGPLRDAGGDVTDPIVALANHPVDNAQYAIRIQNGRSMLVLLQPILALNVISVQTIGEVLVGTEPTNVVSMDFTPDGRLIAMEDSPTGRRMIEINVVTPGNSTQLTVPGSVNQNLASVLSIDPDGRVLSLFTDDTGGNTQLWINAKGNFVPTLGVINTDPASPNVGQFLQLQGLGDDASGAGLASAALNVAVDRSDTGDIFVVTQDNRLMRYRGADGAFVAEVGSLTEPGTGKLVNVSEIAFDVDGTLIGKDDELNRLVTINKNTGSVTGRTQSGAVVSDVVSLALDPTVGLFRGVINTPGAGVDNFVLFRGTTQVALRGLEVESLDDLQITGGTDYSSRVAASRGSFKKVSVDGSFSGSLVTPATIDSFTQSDGELRGLIQAEQEIKKVTLDNVVMRAGSVIRTESVLSSLKQTGGSFGGVIEADSAGTIDIGGGGLPTASIEVHRDAGTVKLGGSYSGTMEIGSISKQLDINGSLGGTADIEILRNAKKIAIDDGADSGSSLIVRGKTDTLDVGDKASGLIAIENGLGKATFFTAEDLTFIVGLNATSITVKGDSTRSLFSVGTRIGIDGDYNTLDDTITGGSIKTVTFNGNYTDTALVAGVLPSLSAGPGKPTNNKLFTGNLASTNILQQDSAEAGGILLSVIDTLTIKGFIVSSNPATGRQSVAASADGFGDKQKIGPFPGQLLTRVYSDPLGAPQIERFSIIDESEFRVIFSEELNSASFILAQDRNDDGDTDDVGDIPGTVELRDETGMLIDDVTLLYATQVNSEGETLGVLRVIRPGGFITDKITVTILGGGPSFDPILTKLAVFDRSGGRSVLRNFNQDDQPFALELPFGNPNGPTVDTTNVEDSAGTLFDGERDGIEGHDSVTLLQFVDAADSFTDALTQAPLPLVVDGGTLTLAGAFEAGDDIDVYRITSAQAYQFLSVSYLSDATTQMAVFIRDTQGTPLNANDDTFEMITRWEQNIQDTPPEQRGGLIDPDLFQAFELRPTEDPTQPDGFRSDNLEYFIVFVANGETGDYLVDITLASTDDLLDGVTDGQVDLQPDEVIAYISNVMNTIDPISGLPTNPVGAHNNFLGFNAPKQLVYLNFEGGTSEFAVPGALVAPFDPAEINPVFNNLEDAFINGAPGVTGILDRIVDTYNTNTVTTHPGGQVNVTILQGDFTPFFDPNATGIFLTTVDPRIAGLDPVTDFKTILIGQNSSEPGTLGIASQIGFANMDKGGEAIIFINEFSFLTTGQGDLTDLVNDMAIAIASTTSHELGHLLGWNHTERDTYRDDPNNDGVAFDSITPGEVELMSSGDLLGIQDRFVIRNLGTAPVNISEFAQIGDFFTLTDSEATIDLMTDAIWWLK